MEIFAGGEQIDSAGKAHDGDWLIQRAIETFNPLTHEPPVVIGHPRHDAPAYGWIEALKAEGNKLLARVKQLAPELADMVKTGRFKKRSASFYADGRLRHVGFLGAAAPAVKGLADVAFADGEFIIFEGAEDDMEVTELERRIATLEAERADLVKQAEADKAQALADLEAKFHEAQAAEKRKAAQDASRNWVAEKVKAGVIPPAIATGLGEFVASLEPEAVFEFGEGRQNAVAYVKQLVETLFEKEPFAALFQEFATKGNAGQFTEAEQDLALARQIAAKVGATEGGK